MYRVRHVPELCPIALKAITVGVFERQTMEFRLDSCPVRGKETDMNRRDFLKTALAATILGSSAFVRKTPAGEFLSSDAAQRTERGKNLKVLVLTGSPRRNGNSNTLADRFVQGAKEAGHEVTRFDSAFGNITPCTACNACGMNGECVLKDDFRSLCPTLLEAEVVAFATPMYYFGVSAQLKTVIDRFYSVSSRLHGGKRAVLMMTYANSATSEAMPIRSHYEVLLNYLGWTDAGKVIAPGVWPIGAIERTPFPEQAYQLGKTI